MILIVSTFSEAPADRAFFRALEAANSDWGPVIHWSFYPAGINKRYWVKMHWNLENNCKEGLFSRFRSTAEDPINLNKHAYRLSNLSGQTFTQGNAQTVVKKFYHYSKAILEFIRPSLVICVNPLIPQTGIPFEIARDVLRLPVATLERGWLPGSFVLDPHGYGYKSKFSSASLDQLMEGCDRNACLKAGQIANAKLAANLSGRGATYAKSQNVSFDDNHSGYKGRYVLVVGMADVNTGVLRPPDMDRHFAMPGFASSQHLASAVSHAHQDLTVFRPHPNTLHLVSEKLCGKSKISLKPLDSLIKNASVVVLNGSSVEFQALAANKPIVLSGKAYLSNKGVAIDALYEKDLPAALETSKDISFSDTDLDRRAVLQGYFALEYLQNQENVKPFISTVNASPPRRRLLNLGAELLGACSALSNLRRKGINFARRLLAKLHYNRLRSASQ